MRFQTFIKSRSWLLLGALVSMLWTGHPLLAQPSDQDFDVLIREGLVYDGSGNPARRADVGIKGDRIAAVGDLAKATAKSVVDAHDLAIAPGFINMLS